MNLFKMKIGDALSQYTGTRIVLVFFILLFSMKSQQALATNGVDHPFLPNMGQWDGDYSFQVDLNNLSVYLTESSFRYVLSENVQPQYDYEKRSFKPVSIKKHAFSMSFVESKPLTYKGLDQSKVYYNYFLGSDPSKWKTSVYPYKSVESSELYDGINILALVEDGQFKYDYIVQPGSNPDQILFNYSGVENVMYSEENLTITTSVGDLIETIPVSYQIIDGKKIHVSCRYRRHESSFGFEFPDGYDSSRPLIIDPVILASTLSGTGNNGYANSLASSAAYDPLGNLYTGGMVDHNSYPLTDGAFQTEFDGTGLDNVISKFNPDGSELIFATYLGGNQIDVIHSIIVDSYGETYILGKTISTDFPVTDDAIQSSIQGGWDLFVTRLSNDGTALLGSTYIGGDQNEATEYFNPTWSGRGEILLTPSGEIVICSSSESPDFPTTSGSFQENLAGELDGLVMKLSPILDEIVWSTFLGGIGDDTAHCLRLKDDNSIVVGGKTISESGFPVTATAYQTEFGSTFIGAGDGFVTHLSEDGSELVNSTLVGGPGSEYIAFLDIDSEGSVWALMSNGSFSYWEPTEGVYGSTNTSLLVQKFSSTLSELEITSGLTPTDNAFGEPVAFMVDDCGRIYTSHYGPSTGFIYSSNAFFSSGPSFYTAVFSPGMENLEFGTYFPAGYSHNGMGRYSNNGVLYHASTISISEAFYIAENAWSSTNSISYDIGAFIIDFEVENVVASAVVESGQVGCAPYEASFENFSNGQTYLWNFGDGTTSADISPTHTFSEPGTYWVQLVSYDTESCNQSDTISIPITVSPPVNLTPAFDYTFDCENEQIEIFNNSESNGEVSYEWNMGDGNTLSESGSSFDYSYSSEGTYTVSLTITDESCGTFSTVEQEVIFVPNIQANFYYESSNNCDGYLVDFFNISEGGADFTWQMGEGSIVEGDGDFLFEYNGPGLYTIMLTIENTESCNQTSTFFQTIELLPPPTLDPLITATQTGPCSDLNILANLNPNGVAGDVSWNIEGEPVGSNEFSLETSLSSGGTYTLTAYVVEPTCDSTYISEVEIDIIETLDFELPTNANLCFYEESIQLDASVPFEGANYSWNNGLSDDPILEVGDPGTYSVDVSYNGCIETQSSSVNYVEAIELYFEEAICSHQENLVDFHDQYGIVDQMYWDNGTTGFTLIVSDVGYYPFTAIDLWGCEQRDSLLAIPHDTDANLQIPNIFTPNGDGRNDEFQISGDPLEYYELQIFDRWGRMVFQNNEMYGTWNGELEATSGEAANENTYMYVLKYQSTCDQSPVSKTGYVKVVR